MISSTLASRKPIANCAEVLCGLREMIFWIILRQQSTKPQRKRFQALLSPCWNTLVCNVCRADVLCLSAFLLFYIVTEISCAGYENFSSKRDKEKSIDIKLSVLTACHSSIRSIDHVTEMIKDVGGKDLKEIKLHRTKCSKIIERVVVPCLMEELVDDIGDRFYSLIIDESTDNTVIRQLALCVKYYSVKYQKHLVEFLGLIETPVATADKLYEVVTLFLNTIGLRLGRLLALGTDGGLNLCGRNHSLYALLKKNDCPWLILVKCTCHSLDKAASYASQELPESLDWMIRESKGHFKNSHNRRARYENLYEVRLFFLTCNEHDSVAR